jgi:hypothetical protein
MLVSGTNQNQFKWTKEAISVHMLIFSISAQHGGLKGIPPSIVHSRWKWHAVLLAGEGIPHDNLALIAIDQDGEAVTAAHEEPLFIGAVSLRQGKAGVRDAVRRVQGGSEERGNMACEEAEQRRLTVVFPEAYGLVEQGYVENGWFLNRMVHKYLTLVGFSGTGLCKVK